MAACRDIDYGAAKTVSFSRDHLREDLRMKAPSGLPLLVSSPNAIFEIDVTLEAIIMDNNCGAMKTFAKSRSPSKLNTKSYQLYVRFGPHVPVSKKVWKPQGRLSLDEVRKLVTK
jgi:hypothetical protein